MTPRVSIITPTYNGVRFIGATIDSVLAQTMSDWELVIVDDCSKDATRELLASYRDPRIRVIPLESNLGPVGARNHALAAARGTYIAALDQDDLIHPTRLEKQTAYLDANPDTVLVASAVALLEEGISGTVEFARGMTPDLIDWLMLMRNPLVWSSVMLRGDAARALDPFGREDMIYAEDFDIYHRLRAFGRLAQLDDELVIYRVHPGGASKRHNDRMEANAKRILTEAHMRLMGSASEDDVTLLQRHVMAREPVPDVATLGAVFDVIGRLYPAFAMSRPITEATLDDIDAQIAQLRRQLCRAALRSGRATAQGGDDGIAERACQGPGRTRRPDGVGTGRPGAAAQAWLMIRAVPSDVTVIRCELPLVQ